MKAIEKREDIKGCSQFATEFRSAEEVLEYLSIKRFWVNTIFNRLKGIGAISDDAFVLDIGAANGSFLIACNELGYRCIGVEPSEEARRTAASISARMKMPIRILTGVAEALPFEDDMFDFVHASSVMEHVDDLETAIREIWRVLRHGGVFWFSSASSMCPIQGEIRGFPLFGWYPDFIKIKIMNWAKDNRPQLIGYTRKPAINWFTPVKAQKVLKLNGFREVYDRWDLRLESEGTKIQGMILKLIRSHKAFKILADMMVPDCSFAAIK